jgi:hypothetical protein
VAQLRNITMILRCDTVKRILPRLKEIETLGMARSLGWKVHMCCANGYRESTRSRDAAFYPARAKVHSTRLRIRHKLV